MSIERRRYARVPYTTRCTVQWESVTYEGETANISRSGAMISFGESTMLPVQEECSLTIFIDGEENPLLLAAKIIYSTMFNVGVHFLDVNEESDRRICSLIETLS